MAKAAQLDDYGNPVNENDPYGYQDPYSYLPPEYKPDGNGSPNSGAPDPSQGGAQPGFTAGVNTGGPMPDPVISAKAFDTANNSGITGGATPPPAPPAPVAAKGAPTGGDLRNADFARQYVEWWGNQPGVNPSVKNDPGYWIGRFTSGAFGNDQNYAQARMMQPEGPPEGAGAPAANPAAMPAPAAAAGAGGGIPSKYDDMIHQTLMNLLQRGSQPVTEDSVRAQYAPVDAVMQRNADRTRAAAAERHTFQGTNFGGAGGPLDAETNSINENLGMDEGKLMAGFIGDELKNKRDDLIQALQFAQGEEKTALQLQISQMDAELRRYGIDSAASTASAQLGQQNNQFYDQMGNNNAWQEYMYNQVFNQNLQ